MLFVAAGWILLSTNLSCKQPASTHVEKVDMDRFMGTWYEVATLPNTYNKGCSCNKLDLEKEESRRYVKMIYACVKKGKQGAMLGKIFPDQELGNAVWKEQYFWPFGSNYYVLSLDAGYTYAMVGSAEKDHFRILTRTSSPEKLLVDSLVKMAGSLGFPASAVIYPAQDCR